jgi:hypothetical protein
VLSAILPLVLLTSSGCGSGSDEDAAAAGVGVRVDPPSALVEPSETVAFQATVTGTAALGVTWSVDCGSITQAGLFTAPATNGTCRVTATSVAGSVSSAALVNVGAGGWAATCAAEPEPTTNVVYACDCQAGADASCVAGNDSNPGTKAQPKQTWGAITAAWRSLPAGGTVALCKGGRWNSVSTGYASLLNGNCSASTPCTMRDYASPWGSTAKPVLAVPANAAADTWLITIAKPLGTSFNPTGYRFLNLRLLNPDGGATPGAAKTIGIWAYENTSNMEVCNCDIDGFGVGAYVASPSSASCTDTGYKFRGNRFLNNCTDAFLGQLRDSVFDGNVFDNNGHALCGSYNLGNQSGGTTHTLYLSGYASCPIENVRIVNNEFRRNAMYQGYTQGSPLKLIANGGNVLVENNLFDGTPVNPSGSDYYQAIHSDSYGATTGFNGFNGITVRRNRIIAGRGPQIAMSSVTNGVIEDNVIYVGTPSNNLGDYIISISHSNTDSPPSLFAIRNNTIYVEGTPPYSSWTAIRSARASSAAGQVITGNSVTFTGSVGSCYRIDDPSKVAFMDNNHCTGGSAFVTNGSAYYTLASWKAGFPAFDGHSIAPPLTGLFTNAPADLTPAVGSPLIGAGSTAISCTVGGVANQSCSSPVAVGSPSWSMTDPGKARSNPPGIGATDR